jgi:hypothetical protein
LRTGIDGNKLVDSDQVKAYIRWELENGEPAVFKQRMQELDNQQETTALRRVGSGTEHNALHTEFDIHPDGFGAQPKLDKGSLVQSLFDSKKMRYLFGAKEPQSVVGDNDDPASDVSKLRQPHAADAATRAMSAYSGWHEAVQAELGQVGDFHRTMVTRFPVWTWHFLVVPRATPDMTASDAVLRAKTVAHFV